MVANITTISPLDSRYRKATESLRGEAAAICELDVKYRPLTEGLRATISDRELARSRIIVEGEYLIHLSKQNLGMRSLSDTEKKLIRSLYKITDEDVEALHAIEYKGWEGIQATNHDVKAVEYFIRKKLEKTSLRDVLGWLHLGLPLRIPIAYPMV